MENMMEWMIKENQKQELLRTLRCNRETERFGLILTEKEAAELMADREETLRENQRVEFGAGILPDIIEYFCDSAFILQENYVATIRELQEIFYLYKNESLDILTDEEILDFMRE